MSCSKNITIRIKINFFTLIKSENHIGKRIIKKFQICIVIQSITFLVLGKPVTIFFFFLAKFIYILYNLIIQLVVQIDKSSSSIYYSFRTLFSSAFPIYVNNFSINLFSLLKIKLYLFGIDHTIFCCYNL